MLDTGGIRMNPTVHGTRGGGCEGGEKEEEGLWSVFLTIFFIAARTGA